MRITIEPYNPEWATQFTSIAQHLQTILSSAKVPYKGIEHVGSTSVPSMPAKPHIDIDIIVAESQVQPALSALEQTGHYQSLGELGFPSRWAVHFKLATNGTTVPSRSTYVCIEGCQALRNHLAVRDVCRAIPGLREEYARVKMDLARREWEDVSGYYVEKSEVIERILTEAGMGGEVEEIWKLNLASRTKVEDANRAVAS